jgi:predicted transcriptional regulator
MVEFERESPFWERKKAVEMKGELLQLTRAVLKKYYSEDEGKNKVFFSSTGTNVDKRVEALEQVVLEENESTTQQQESMENQLFKGHTF